jgi:hypothetical protein
MFVFQAVLHSPSVRQRELYHIEQLTKQTMERFYSPRKQQRRQLEQQQHRSNSRSRSRHRCASNQTLHSNTRRRTSKRSSSDTSVMSMMSVTQLPCSPEKGVILDSSGNDIGKEMMMKSSKKTLPPAVATKNNGRSVAPSTHLRQRSRQYRRPPRTIVGYVLRAVFSCITCRAGDESIADTESDNSMYLTYVDSNGNEIYEL